MKINILVDSNKFFSTLKTDINHAKKCVYIQAMTIEADQAGVQLFNLLKESSINDIRLLVDSYIKAVISDKFLYSPQNYFNTTIQNEYKNTISSINELNNLGIPVKFTNPLGPVFIKIGKRNHKKLIIIDDKIAYIGGINFSDHNFLWHDMMVRIENNEVAKYLKDDFLITWSGKNQYSNKIFDSIEIIILDGKSNETAFEPIFRLIDNANNSIKIESPYLTFPFFEKLRQAKKRGVKIDMVCPLDNNKSIIQKYTLWESQRSNINLLLYQKNMTHLKALLIDDKFLILGSSNFDYFSFRTQQELIAIIRDKQSIESFKNQVWQIDYNNSVKWDGRVSHINGLIRYIFLKTIFSLSVKLSNY